MNSEKILSLIVPTYKAEKYLEKCLQSFLVKDMEIFKKLQVIVVNDGSPDQSGEIAEKYMEKYPEIYMLINKENGGHGSGINVGTKAACGKYMKVIDADDWVDTDELEIYIRKLQDCETDAVVTSFRTYDISTGNEQVYKVKGENKICNLSEIMEHWGNFDKCMTFHGITYRTEFYQKLNYELIEKVFYEDNEYATIPMSMAKTIATMQECVYVYRIGDVNQSVSDESQVARINDLKKVIDKMLAFEKKYDTLSQGAREYWKKKTSMTVTSYYQVALLKNKEKREGRKLVGELNQELEKRQTVIYEDVHKKCKYFIFMSYFSISNAIYNRYKEQGIKVYRFTKHVKY